MKYLNLWNPLHDDHSFSSRNCLVFDVDGIGILSPFMFVSF